eukprot:COSAG06_NODE_815_length_12103_cov_4.891458_8_plen_239_part_00
MVPNGAEGARLAAVAAGSELSSPATTRTEDASSGTSRVATVSAPNGRASALTQAAHEVRVVRAGKLANAPPESPGSCVSDPASSVLEPAAAQLDGASAEPAPAPAGTLQLLHPVSLAATVLGAMSHNYFAQDPRLSSHRYGCASNRATHHTLVHLLCKNLSSPAREHRRPSRTNRPRIRLPARCGLPQAHTLARTLIIHNRPAQARHPLTISSTMQANTITKQVLRPSLVLHAAQRTS